MRASTLWCARSKPLAPSWLARFHTLDQIEWQGTSARCTARVPAHRRTQALKSDTPVARRSTLGHRVRHISRGGLGTSIVEQYKYDPSAKGRKTLLVPDAPTLLSGQYVDLRGSS